VVTGSSGSPVGGGEARRAARAELSGPEYHHRHHPNPFGRVADWVGDHLGRLLGQAGSGGGHAVLLAVLVLLAVAVVFAARAGLPARAGRPPGAAAGEDPLAAADAREHRRLAERYTAAGRHAEALREWLRAAIATVEERGILPPRPGRTGAATAAEAGPVLPAAAPDLTAAVRAFDEVWFGGRPATDEDVLRARAAADQVAAARPRPDARPPAGLVPPW